MKLKTLVTTTLLSCFAVTAHADLLLDLRLDDTTRARTVTSGSSVFVDMFLVDTDATSPMVAGLIGGGGRIHAAGSAGATGGLVTPGPGFTGPSSSPPGPGIASASVSSMFPFSVAPVPVGSGVTVLAGALANEIMLARFSVTATGGGGDSVTLTADRLGPPFLGNLAFGGPPISLDALPIFMASAGTESVTLSIAGAAVPEASTWLVAILLAVGAVFVRRSKGLENAAS